MPLWYCTYPWRICLCLLIRRPAVCITGMARIGPAHSRAATAALATKPALRTHRLRSLDSCRWTARATSTAARRRKTISSSTFLPTGEPISADVRWSSRCNRIGRFSCPAARKTGRLERFSLNGEPGASATGVDPPVAVAPGSPRLIQLDTRKCVQQPKPRKKPASALAASRDDQPCQYTVPPCAAFQTGAAAPVQILHRRASDGSAAKTRTPALFLAVLTVMVS
jgi:hypothetical protein